MKRDQSLLRRPLYALCLSLILLLAQALPGPPGIGAGIAMAQDTTTENGLTLWLKFDEAAGATTFADSSGAGRNATCTGTKCPTAAATGRLGQAASFDDNDRITVNHNAPTGPFSLAVWVNRTGTGWQTIFEFGDDAPWIGTSSANQAVLFDQIAGGMVPQNQWTHLAYTWDGTTNRLYVNGKQVAQNTTAPDRTGQGLNIGAENNDTFAWHGLLDDLRIYSRTLSAAEVGTLARPGTATVTPPQNPAPDNPRLIDLTVSIYKAVPDAAARQPYENILQHFADSVFEMSNGIHKVRTITVYDRGRFSDRTDVIWTAFQSAPSANTNGYGKRGSQVQMADAIFNTNTTYNDPADLGKFIDSFAHEWGHYFYGMYDEYEGRGTSTDPTDPMAGDTPPIPCSVMCGADDVVSFNTYNFSTPKSTRDQNRTRTANYRGYNASGWEVVARSPANDPQAVRGRRLHWPELAALAPAAGQDPSVEIPAQRAAARSALNIVWADANATASKQRILMVDISADMGQNNKLASTKLSLKNYVNRSNVGDQIGIITFADTHTVVQPLTTIEGDATKATLRNAIDAIQVKAGVNDRNIDAGLQAAIGALKQASNNAAVTDQGVYVIIDGGYTDRTEPFIFQKVDNLIAAAGLTLSVFNFSTQVKNNDLYSNSLVLLRPQRGTYTQVSSTGFALPTRRRGDTDTQRGDELFEALQSVDQEYSAVVDVDLGSSQGIEVSATSSYSTTIFVDPTLDALEVAVYLFAENTNNATLSLTDSNSTTHSPSYCDGNDFDTVCVFEMETPEAGEWVLGITAGSETVYADFDAVGIADEGFTPAALLEIKDVDSTLVTYPQEVVVVATLVGEDPIAGAATVAWVENPDGTVTDLDVRDDGVAPDTVAEDGRYTGIMPYTQGGDHHVTVHFENISGSAVYTKKGLADVVSFTTEPVPFDFDRFASLEIVIDGFASDDHGDAGENATDLVANNEDVPGKIDSTEDVDRFRITSPLGIPGESKNGESRSTRSGTTQTYALRLTHLPPGLNAQVRVTSSSGTRTYSTNGQSYDGYLTIPVALSPGELIYVEVTSASGQRTTGTYDISFGVPLPGELVPGLYLPSVER